MALDFNHKRWRWNEITTECLGSRLAKYTKKIRFDILLVDEGLKPGFLFDYGMITSAKITKLLHMLCEENMISNFLNVVTVDSDVLITHPKQSEQFLKNLKETVSFVDISQGNDKPQILQEWTPVQPSLEIYSTMCKQMVCDKIFNIETEITSDVNVSTLYGLLLGFPVIYWYSLMGQKESENNLSMEPLRNYQCVLCYGDNFKEGFERIRVFHDVYSFTVPECVCSAVSDKVNQWWEKVKCNYSQPDKLEMSRRAVTLPVVVL